MAAKRAGGSDEEKFHAGTRERHIHPPQVGQETDLSLIVGPDQRDDHNIPLLPLKSIDRVHRNPLAERPQSVVAPHETAQKHTCAL